MNSYVRTTTLAKELLCISDAERGLLMEQDDIMQGQFRYRWFAGGRTAAFSLSYSDVDGPYLNLDAIDPKLREVVEVWRATEAGNDSDAEYQRRMDAATAAGLPWAQEQYVRA